MTQPMSDDVRATIELVLTFARRNEGDEDYMGTNAHINQRIDTALAWLTQHAAQPPSVRPQSIHRRTTMQRNEVYRAIDSERAYQQAQGKPDEQPISEWTGWIMHYRTKAFDAYWAGDHQAALHEIRKIAALAVAALEQYGCEPREGYEPPRVQPYSHRNGESDAPTEIGHYWIVDGDHEWVDYWDNNSWEAGWSLHSTARIYGPIPSPLDTQPPRVQESDNAND